MVLSSVADAHGIYVLLSAVFLSLQWFDVNFFA